MYENYYGFSAKPFGLRPDPHFFYASKGHKRAMAYLEYGLAQGEGFIVITGEVGAGKTTLVRNMLNGLKANQQIVAAHIVNTHLSSDDTLRMVLAGFGLDSEGGSKSALLTRLEAFLRACEAKGQRALLIVDEAQNLTPRTVEELRMLSNFQTDDRSLLQTFLLGQPELRVTMHGPDMQQLRQRVIATYHLGPMDADETLAFIEHRLRTVGWRGTPSFSSAAHAAIYAYSGGIPRIINHLCDRLLLMGYLEELHAYTEVEVGSVIADISAEFQAPADVVAAAEDDAALALEADSYTYLLEERLARVEQSMVQVLHALRKLVRRSRVDATASAAPSAPSAPSASSTPSASADLDLGPDHE